MAAISLPRVIEQVKLACEYHIEGKCEEAETMLLSIDHAALKREYAESKKRTPKGSRSEKTIDTAKRLSRSISEKTKLALFRRDHFICHYCGKPTIYTPTLRVLSLLYPSALPYHRNGDFDIGHFIYWTHIASPDHKDAHAHGGDSTLGNLVTSCYLCNHRKNSARHEEFGVNLLPEPTYANWDGLSLLYQNLYPLFPDASLSGTLRDAYRAVSQ